MSETKTRGETLGALRVAKGLTQGELAAAIGIKTQGTISNWENDKQDIDPANLLKLVEFFGVAPDVLGYELPHMTGATPPAWFTDYMAVEQQRHEQLAATLKTITDQLALLINPMPGNKLKKAT